MNKKEKIEMLSNISIKNENGEIAIFEEKEENPFQILEGYKIEFSKTGLPCMWESGGGSTNTGGTKIVCYANGAPKKAIYIPRGGRLSNGEHALIPIAAGDVLIFHGYDRRGAETRLEKVTQIVGEKAYTEAVEMQDCYKNAVEAAIKKAHIYHCREAVYVK